MYVNAMVLLSFSHFLAALQLNLQNNIFSYYPWYAQFYLPLSRHWSQKDRDTHLGKCGKSLVFLYYNVSERRQQ